MNLGPNASVSLSCLFEIQQEVKFEKTGKNTRGGNYEYYKLGDLLGPIKPALKTHSCVVLFSTPESECKGGFAKVQGSNDVAPKDKLVTYAYARVTARIQHVNDVEDFVETTLFGYKVDQTSDKALGAYTIGARYALMALFNVEGEFDPDSDAHDVRGNDIMSQLTPQKGASKPASNLSASLENLGLGV